MGQCSGEIAETIHGLLRAVLGRRVRSKEGERANKWGGEAT